MAAEKSVLLPVSADEAFALLTEPDRLRRWKTISARVDLRAGGAYRWTIVPGHAAAGTFREIEPGRRIVFGWGWEGSPDLAPDASTVTVTLEPVEGGTLVRLVHEGLTPEQEASHLAGWTHFFARLERAATAGDAGPDEWAASPPDLDPLVSADATLAVCQHVLRGISPDDLARPTPCEDLTVAELADLISLLAQAQTASDRELAEAVWKASATAVGWGPSGRHERAKALARAGDAGAAAALLEAAGEPGSPSRG